MVFKLMPLNEEVPQEIVNKEIFKDYQTFNKNYEVCDSCICACDSGDEGW